MVELKLQVCETGLLVCSAAEFRKYCKRLHVDMYMKRRRLHAKV